MGAAAHRQFAAALNRTGRPMYLEVKDCPPRDRFHSSLPLQVVAGFFFLGKQIADVVRVVRVVEARLAFMRLRSGEQLAVL